MLGMDNFDDYISLLKVQYRFESSEKMSAQNTYFRMEQRPGLGILFVEYLLKYSAHGDSIIIFRPGWVGHPVSTVYYKLLQLSAAHLLIELKLNFP